MTPEESAKLERDTQWIRADYDVAIRGLNILWGMFGVLDDTAYADLRRALIAAYDQQYDAIRAKVLAGAV